MTTPDDPSPQPASSGPGRGLLIVMTGASGVGKGTLRERWLAGQDVFYSTSWTTREARPGERDGDLEGVLRAVAALALPRAVTLPRPSPRPRRSSPATCRRSGEADWAWGGRRVVRSARARRRRRSSLGRLAGVCRKYSLLTAVSF